MSEYEREMWEELYSIRTQVDSVVSYMQQIVKHLAEINRKLSAPPASGGDMSGPPVGEPGGKSGLSSFTDRLRGK